MRNLSPKLKKWLDEFNKNAAALIAAGFKPTTVNARDYLYNLTREYIKDIPEVPLILDDLVYTPEWLVPVRIYHPQPQKALPVFLYFHGGGGMAGGVASYDAICRKLALATNHIVISVEYRLAPENPYPCAVKDAYWTSKNLWSTLDARKLVYCRELVVGGDSAGGTLTASTMEKAQFETDLIIKKAVMITPGLDFTMSFPSIDENGVGFLLQKAKVSWYYDHLFLHAHDRKAASPLFGAFTNRMPETLMITAEFCLLRDENYAYLEQLKRVGVKYQHVHFNDMIHNFISLEDLVKEECQKVYKTIADFLK